MKHIRSTRTFKKEKFDDFTSRVTEKIESGSFLVRVCVILLNDTSMLHPQPPNTPTDPCLDEKHFKNHTFLDQKMKDLGAQMVLSSHCLPKS